MIWLSRVQGGRERQRAGMRERRDEKNSTRVDRMFDISRILLYHPVARPGPEAAHRRSRARIWIQYGRIFNSIIRECHQWWHRDGLEHVASDVLRLPKKRARRWQVNDVLRTQRQHPPAARDVDHDFGRVDEHRDIAGL
jgi:hypothetical protein